jgi:hypothetical protein
MTRTSVVIMSLFVLSVLGGCQRDGARADRDGGWNDSPDRYYPSASPPIDTDRQPPAHKVRTPRGDTEGGATFADWVVSMDPDRRYIRDAFVRDERVLAVIVSPTMTPREVDEALHWFLTAMGKTFPGRVEAVASYESGDLLPRLVWNAARGEIQRVGGRERPGHEHPDGAID